MSNKLCLCFLLVLVAVSGGCASIAKGVAGPVHELRNALVGDDQEAQKGESAEDVEVEPMFKVYQRHGNPVSSQAPYCAYGNDANWYRAKGEPVPSGLIVEKRHGHATWESNPGSKRKW